MCITHYGCWAAQGDPHGRYIYRTRDCHIVRALAYSQPPSHTTHAGFQNQHILTDYGRLQVVNVIHTHRPIQGDARGGRARTLGYVEVQYSLDVLGDVAAPRSFHHHSVDEDSQDDEMAPQAPARHKATPACMAAVFGLPSFSPVFVRRGDTTAST
jgi:hypothetical protein